MYNITDYVDQTSRPDIYLPGITPEDALALALAASWDWSDLPPEPLTLAQAALKCGVYDAAYLNDPLAVLMRAMANSPHFGALYISGFEKLYSEQPALQFTAVTLSDGKNAFIAFRGTDDSVAGWMENIELAYSEPVPAQTAALRYLNRIAARYPGQLVPGGHSKGGGLALFSATYAGDLQPRIARVYSFDGPGLSRAAYESADYQRIRERLLTLVPPQSIVGMLLWQDGEFRVVHSSAQGALQHDAFTWQTTPAHFDYAPELSPASLRLRTIARALALSLPPVALKRLTDSLYELVLQTDARTLHELNRYFAAHPEKLAQAQGGADGRAMYMILYLIASAAA